MMQKDLRRRPNTANSKATAAEESLPQADKTEPLWQRLFGAPGKPIKREVQKAVGQRALVIGVCILFVTVGVVVALNNYQHQVDEVMAENGRLKEQLVYQDLKLKTVTKATAENKRNVDNTQASLNKAKALQEQMYRQMGLTKSQVEAVAILGLTTELISVIRGAMMLSEEKKIPIEDAIEMSRKAVMRNIENIVGIDAETLYNNDIWKKAIKVLMDSNEPTPTKKKRNTKPAAAPPKDFRVIGQMDKNGELHS